jgi:uncharacterized BrkB/YihY/UPF0761 family membrane protein
MAVAEPQQEIRPTWLRLAATYYVMLIIFAGGIFGSVVVIAGTAFAATTCQPGDRPVASIGTLRVSEGVLSGLIMLYCAGCAIYLYRLTNHKIHAVFWGSLALATLGTGLFLVATAGVGHWCF